MTKSRVISPKPITEEMHLLSKNNLALVYDHLRKEIADLEEKKSLLQEEIKSRLVDGKLETDHGTFNLESRRSLSWGTNTIKEIFGRNWTSFAKPDEKLLRARMETKDEIGCALEVSAVVKVSSALTLIK